MRISRPTLREAVKVLTKAGVVEVRPGSAGGIFVLTDCVPIAFIQAEQNIRLAEIGADLEARRVLEPSVAKFAARCDRLGLRPHAGDDQCPGSPDAEGRRRRT